MSRPYAAGTTVTANRTEAEIKDLLTRRGVTKIATMVDCDAFSIVFEFGGVAYRSKLPLPDPEDPAFTEYSQKSVTYRRAENASRELYAKELNRRWRAFGMVIKAKLVAVEEGISTMQEEFFGQAVTGNGQTVAERFLPELPKILGGSAMSALAGGGK